TVILALSLSLVPNILARQQRLVLLGETLVLEDLTDETHDLHVHLVVVGLELLGGVAHLLVEVLIETADGLGEGLLEVVVLRGGKSGVGVAYVEVVLDESLLGAGLENAEVARLELVDVLLSLRHQLLESRLEIGVSSDDIVVERRHGLLEDDQTFSARRRHGDLLCDELVVQVDQLLQLLRRNLLDHSRERRREAVCKSLDDALELVRHVDGDVGVDRPVEAGDRSGGSDGGESEESDGLHTVT
ncbi:hypothetical protein PFISCL1PPCAC_9764, partial [Pristionchus fissidentatus]